MRRRAVLSATVAAAVLAFFLASCAFLFDSEQLAESNALRETDGETGVDNPIDAEGGTLDGGPCDVTFCDDFERETVQGPWTRIVSSEGELELVAVDGGLSLATYQTRGSKLANPRAALIKELGTASRIQYALDLTFLGTVQDFAVVCSIEVGMGDGARGSISILASGGGAVLFGAFYTPPDGGTRGATRKFENLVPGERNHLEISVSLDETPFRYTIKMNGLTAVDRASTDGTGPAMVKVQAGLSSSHLVGDSFRLLVDNVVVDVTP